MLTIIADAKILQTLTSSSFTFSRIFDEESTQKEVYEITCHPQVQLLLNEFQNSLIFTYGITNAGKTFTVIGSPEKPGILPQMIMDIHSQVKDLLANSNEDYLFCNFIEIYNEEIFDLLSPSCQEENKDPKILKKRNDPNNPFKKKVYLKERDKKFIIQGNKTIKLFKIIEII